MEENKVYLIAVLPKDSKRCRYIINNQKDVLSMRNDSLYDFIAKEIAPYWMLSRIREYMRTFTPFIIDIRGNEIMELEFDTTEELQRIKASQHFIDTDKAKQEYEESNVDDKSRDRNRFYKLQGFLDSLTKKLNHGRNEPEKKGVQGIKNL